MKRILPFCLLAMAIAHSAPPQKRPRITGIDHVAFYTTDAETTKKLYTETLGLASTPPVEYGEVERFQVGSQWVGYSAAPDPTSTSRLDHVAFTTDDVEALRKSLAAAGIKVPEKIDGQADGSSSFFIADPEGNDIEFVQRGKNDHAQTAPGPVSHRMIHTGFTVHDRAAEDRFYKDILGFHLYWYGGMQPERTDWVAMQVPDGTDWLEYMLNQPDHLDLRRNGVMDHISLGVRDMKQAQALLESHGWKSSTSEHSQMGKDGKWQLNVFDPDHTRIELMEFRPVEKPCCSEFQRPHPSD
jgi:catechol 2,3-dioxygenase-like lactoylglutathione lyase family enzyme